MNTQQEPTILIAYPKEFICHDDVLANYLNLLDDGK